MKPDTKKALFIGIIGLVGGVVLIWSVFFFPQYSGALASAEGLSHVRQISLSNLSAIEKPDNVRRGSLLFRVADTDDMRLAPLVATEVSFEVGGIIARGTIRQTFANPTDQWLEGIYVFPLPEIAAVDSLTMRVGDRTIAGLIKGREEARKTYEAAKAEGMRAALLESERPNVFTSSVANIGPGATITVSFQYQQKLRYDQGVFRLRFPMVVAPRYNPHEREIASAGGGAVTANPASTAPAKKDGIPVVTTDEINTNPVSLEISLKPGFPVGELMSPYHTIDVKQLAEDHYQITLKEKVVAADRDFELVWKPEKGTEPTAGLFSEATDGGHYLMAMIMPPTMEVDEKQVPREVVFVIDTSGSMSGVSIEQARQALNLAIEHLKPEDRFNVIRFDSYTSALFHEPRPANDEAKKLARKAIDLLDAGGGTNMAPAIELALSGRAPKGYLRQVVFITDGAIGNEQELFGIVKERLGRSRLFTVGIGSAPNSYFMVKAAEVGRGTHTYISETTEVGDRMSGLFKKLEMPVLTDLHATWPEGVDVETSTPALPDLYAGEPVVVMARASDLKGELSIKGCIGKQPWRAVLSLGSPSHASGVAKLWARDKIDNLMIDLFGPGNPDETRKQVVTLALEHSLVTEFTSLVAVDSTPARPGEERLTSQNVPVNLPRGWDQAKVFGRPGQANLAQNKVSYDLLLAAPVMQRSAPQASGPITNSFVRNYSHSNVLLPRRKISGAGVEVGHHSELWAPSSDIKTAQQPVGKSADDKINCGRPLKG
jgi:Ca-activated chloride channel homolog